MYGGESRLVMSTRAQEGNRAKDTTKTHKTCQTQTERKSDERNTKGKPFKMQCISETVFLFKHSCLQDAWR